MHGHPESLLDSLWGLSVLISKALHNMTDEFLMRLAIESMSLTDARLRYPLKICVLVGNQQEMQDGIT